MAPDTPKPSETILAAATPTDALRLIAEWADSVEERLAVAPVAEDGGWGDWQPVSNSDSGQPSSAGVSATDDWAPDPEDEATLAVLESELKGCEDAETGKALRAKIELTRDKLKPPLEMADSNGRRANMIWDDEGNVVVELPPPTAAQVDLRGELVTQLGLQDQYGQDIGSTAEENYLKSGPLLLYYADRDYVNGLPQDIKQQMVMDVEISSPGEAMEMGRDLLKADTDSSNDMSAAAERIQGNLSG